jgi:tetratricopeptide (TPR) repeat protein
MSTAARRYHVRGRALRERGEITEAIDALASAVDLAPHSADARVAYAAALCELGDTPRAGQTLRSGLAHALTPAARASLWLALGEVLTAAGDFPAAHDAFDRAAEHPAWTARAAAGRARVLAKIGRYPDAVAALLIAARGR